MEKMEFSKFIFYIIVRYNDIEFDYVYVIVSRVLMIGLVWIGRNDVYKVIVVI